MLISKEQHCRSPVKKLEEELDNRITGLPGKNLRSGKTKTYLDKLSLLLKRITLREQENVSIFEFGLIKLAVLKCLFRHNLCKCSLSTRRKLSLFTHFFLQSKTLLMYIMYNIQANVKYLKTYEILNVSLNFDIYSFVQISRNLGFFAI